MASKALLVGLLLLACLSLGSAVFPKRSRFTESPAANIFSSVDPAVLASKPRLPHNLNVFQYDIQIQPYFTYPGVTFYPPTLEGTFDGKTTVYFQMTETTTQIQFDALNLDVYAFTLSTNGIRQQLVSTDYNNSTKRYTVIPALFLKAGSNYTATFSFTGKINRYQEGGLFYSTYTNPDQSTGNIYATFFEIGDGARSLYPCFDDPHFKAVFNLTVIYPKTLVVIANTLEDAHSDAGNGYQATRFKMTPPMSTYLLAFAIGDLVSKTATTFDGVQIRVWSWRTSGMYLDEAVSSSKTCVEVMTNFTGIKFPMEKMDHLAVPQFGYGGMENWGLVIYIADYIFYDKNQDTTETLVSGIDVRCHEIAHQWFGDLVTADWWSEIMLHESFAAYFEDYALVSGWPTQINYLDASYVANSIEDGFNSDTWNSHPVITPDGTFDGVVYAKGSGLFRMLSRLLSPTIFQNGLRDYLNKYKFSTANHYQLFEAMNAAVAVTSQTDWCGKPLNVTLFMEPWLMQPHYPLLTVNYDVSSRTFFVEQQPFVPRKYLTGDYHYAWPVPFYAKQITTGALKKYWTNRYYPCGAHFEGENAGFTGVQIPAVGDDPLVVNTGSNTFARVWYDDYTFNRLLDGLKNGDFQLTDETLIRMINDELAIVHRNERLDQPASYLRSLKLTAVALNNTDSAAVFGTAMKLIDEMVRLGVDMNERELFEYYFQTILTQFYQKTSWEGVGTGWNGNVLRERLLFYSVYFNIGDARIQASQRSQTLMAKCGTSANWITCNNISTDIRAAVYCGAMIRDDGTIYMKMQSILLNLNQDSPSDQESAALAEGLACTQTNLKQYVLLMLASPRRQTKPSYLSFLVRNPGASDVIYSIMQSMMGTVSIKPNGFEQALRTMTYNWYTPKRIEQLHALVPLLGSNQYDLFLRVYSDIVAKSQYYTAAYLEIVRHLYDDNFPLGFTPWTRKLPVTATPLTYQLSVQPYIPNKSFVYPSERNFTYDANVTITLQTTIDTSELWLNSHRHVIEAFSVLNLDTNETLDVERLTRDFTNAMVVLHMADSPILAGTNLQVTFNYSGFIFPTTPNEGTLSNYDYLTADGRKSWIFATDFEGGPSTRSLVPSFDEPKYKAKWQVSIIYPGEFTALSNTLEQEVANVGNGLMQTTFKQTNEMSSYLLALTIGHYSCLKGVSTVDRTLVRIWTWTGMENYGNFALDFAITAVDHLSATLKTPMPLEKFDVLALPQYSGYSAGAMENWGLVIAGYFDVLFNPEYSTTEQLANIQNTVSHELTHHWFGDLVTLDWWNHIFLNEGFATYWPPEILAAKYPQQNNSAVYDRFFTHETALSLDDNPASARPVSPDPNLLGPDYCLFCDNVYEKGSSVINTLRRVFGSDAHFYSALSTYMKTWSFKNPSDKSLWAVMDAAAQQYRVRGWTGNTLNVTDMMLPYTYQWSGPQIRVIASGNGRYSIAQNPIVPASNFPFSPFNYQWYIPFKYQVNGGSLSSVQWISSVSTSLNINADSNTPVIINPQAQTHARVSYDDASWAPIQKALMSNPTIFDETSRAQLLADSWAFTKKKSISWQRFLNLTLYLQRETSPLVWRSVVREDNFLQMLWHNFRFTNVSTNLNIYFRTISSGVPTPNFTLTGDWSTDISNSLMVDIKCRIGDNSCAAKSKAAFNAAVQACQNPSGGTGKCNPTPPDFRTQQFCLGLRQSPKDTPTILSLFQWWQANPPANDYFPQDMEFLLNGLSCLNDPGITQDLIKATLNGTLPVDFFRYLADNDQGGSALLNYLTTQESDVLTSQYFQKFISAMVTDWSSDNQLQALTTLNAKTTLSQRQHRIVQAAIDQVNSLRTWLSTEGTPIVQWLGKFVTP